MCKMHKINSMNDKNNNVFCLILSNFTSDDSSCMSYDISTKLIENAIKISRLNPLRGLAA